MSWFPAEHGVSSEIQVPSLLSVLGQQGHVPGRKKNPLWSNGNKSLGIAQRLSPEMGLCASVLDR